MKDKIKVGETYNIRVKVIGIAKNGVDAIYVDDEGIAGLHIGKRRVGILRPISPENGIKNTESAPKYDPCRKFRKGDIVEPCSVNGRWSSHVWEERSSLHYEVTKAEDPLTAQMEVKDTDSPWSFLVHAAFFKLVTPEEGYFRVDGDEDEQEFHVIKGALFVASYGYGADDYYKKEEAKAAAQAECDRLNELYRKEME